MPLLPTPEAARLWRLLKELNLVTTDPRTGQSVADIRAAVKLVHDHRLKSDMKPGHLSGVLLNTSRLYLEHAAQLADASCTDLSFLAYDNPPRRRDVKPPRLEQVLKMRI